MTMPAVPSGIRGISEQRRVPRLDRIRLGRRELNKKPCKDHRAPVLECDGCTHPVMSPYFVFGRSAAGETLRRMFGDECTALPVALPSDDPAEFARRNFEEWGYGTLKCRGNGEIAQALVDVAAFERYQAAGEQAKAEGRPVPPPPDGLWASTARAGRGQRQGAEPERRMIPCFGLGYDGAPPCPRFAAAKCAPSLHLSVIVRGFPGLGAFQIDSGSVVNVQRIDDFLAYLGSFTGGRFAMLPLWLRLEPYEMRGRTYHGLALDVDFAALATAGAGALPQAAQLTIADRVLAYLPDPSQPRPELRPEREPDDEPPIDVVDARAAAEPDAAEAPDDVPPYDDDPAPVDLAGAPDQAGGLPSAGEPGAAPAAAGSGGAVPGSTISAETWREVGPQLRAFLARWPTLEEAEAWLRREQSAGDPAAAVILDFIGVRPDGSAVLRFTGRSDRDVRELEHAIGRFVQSAPGV